MGIFKDIADTVFGVYDRAKVVSEKTRPGATVWFGPYNLWLNL